MTIPTDSHFRRHAFMCTNRRSGAAGCGTIGNAEALQRHARRHLTELTGGKAAGEIRINASGCLGRCKHGPTMVVYPEAVWYTYATREDIEEIVTRHLVAGEIVERLKL